MRYKFSANAKKRNNLLFIWTILILALLNFTLFVACDTSPTTTTGSNNGSGNGNGNTGNNIVTCIGVNNCNGTLTATQMNCTYYHGISGTADAYSLNLEVKENCVDIVGALMGSINENGISVSWNHGGIVAFPPSVLSGTFSDGEIYVVPSGDANDAYCSIVKTYRQNNYAMDYTRPLSGWSSCP